MKKCFKALLSSVIVVGLALTVGVAPVQAAEKQQISNIVAFGDSFSDNGSANAVSKEVLASGNKDAYIKPGELYWENRYSNGKTAIEVLAEMADKPLKNYATGGATTGLANYSDWMDSLGYTGVLGQIKKYEADLNGKQVDPNTLHFIFAGGNDYFKFLDYQLEGTIEETADQAVLNIKTSIENLAKLGAKKFLVAGSIDLSVVPFEITMGRTADAIAFTNRVNAALPWMIKEVEKELGVSITFFDIKKVTDEMIKNPIKFGITNIDTPAQPTYPEVKPVVSNVDQYLFFDEWHCTRITHRTIGERMYDVYKTIK